MLVDLGKALSAVKIVGVDDGKGFFYDILTTKDGVTCSPGFCSVGRFFKSAGKTSSS